MYHALAAAPAEDERAFVMSAMLRSTALPWLSSYAAIISGRAHMISLPYRILAYVNVSDEIAGLEA